MVTNHKSAAVLNIMSIDDQTGEFEGYGSVWRTEPDAHNDIVVKGAYKNTLATHSRNGTMPKMFWQHDPSEVIGKWISAAEDETGLFMRGKLNMEVQRGREAHALLKDDAIDGLSIGYPIKNYDRDKETETWFLKELDLWEVSVVSIGADDLATISSVKAAKAAQSILDKFKAGDRLTEREFEHLLKGTLGFSNSQAERAARIHLKGPRELAADNDSRALIEALRN